MPPKKRKVQTVDAEDKARKLAIEAAAKGIVDEAIRTSDSPEEIEENFKLSCQKIYEFIRLHEGDRDEVKKIYRKAVRETLRVGNSPLTRYQRKKVWKCMATYEGIIELTDGGKIELSAEVLQELVRRRKKLNDKDKGRGSGGGSGGGCGGGSGGSAPDDPGFYFQGDLRKESAIMDCGTELAKVVFAAKKCNVFRKVELLLLGIIRGLKISEKFECADYITSTLGLDSEEESSSDEEGNGTSDEVVDNTDAATSQQGRAGMGVTTRSASKKVLREHNKA